MPFKIEKNGEEWCVTRNDPRRVPARRTFGCHASEEKAKRQLAALQASEAREESGQ